MQCLVTGVAGFIGSHIAERLLADGHEVRGIDGFIDYYLRSVKERNLARLRAHTCFRFVEGNLLNLHLPSLLEGIDWIFHQAAQPGVRTSWGHDFVRYTDCNVLATQCLLEAVLRVGNVRRFVYASSSSVYGDAAVLPITEDVLPQPLSPYGVTKLAGEHLCMLYQRNFGVPTVSLRYFTVYGPRQRPDMAFHRFCKAVLDAQPIHLYGDGNQTRDFTYITDVVEANILAVNKETAIGEVVNIAGGSRVTMHEAVGILQDIAGSPIDIMHDQKQHGDVRHTFADTSRAARVLGYSPQVSLREGLAREFEDIAALYEHYR